MSNPRSVYFLQTANHGLELYQTACCCCFLVCFCCCFFFSFLACHTFRLNILTTHDEIMTSNIVTREQYLPVDRLVVLVQTLECSSSPYTQTVYDVVPDGHSINRHVRKYRYYGVTKSSVLSTDNTELITYN